MPNQPDTPRDLGSPERRAKLVAGIRALADLLESDPTLPLPQAVSAQYSILGPLDESGRRLVRDVATHLGVGPGADRWEATHTYQSDTHASLTFEVAPGSGVKYVVHGNTDRIGGEQV